MEGTILCPRCRHYRYTPYKHELVEGAPYPALSRMDNKTYICSPCGTDEALRDHLSLPPIAPTDWPLNMPPAEWMVGR